MRGRWWTLVVITLGAGCPPRTSEYGFPGDYAAAMCEKSEICQWAELPVDYDECTDLLEAAVDAERDICSDFSLAAARDCLSEIRRMSCDQGSAYQEPGRYPGSCAAVYDCYGTTYTTPDY